MQLNNTIPNSITAAIHSKTNQQGPNQYGSLVNREHIIRASLNSTDFQLTRTLLQSSEVHVIGVLLYIKLHF